MDGYGILTYRRRPGTRAHRVAYAEAHGLDVLTMGGVVLHSCDNPSCVNPAHLSLGTPADNSKDRDAKGRQPLGIDKVGAVLTDGIVLECRRRFKYKCRVNGSSALAREFGVSQPCMYDAIKGITWCHVTNVGIDL